MAADAGTDYSTFDPNDIAIWEQYEKGGSLEEARQWGWAGEERAPMQRYIGRRWNAVFDHLNSTAPWSETTDPFRLRTQKLLSVAFRQIKPENGFYCDLSDLAVPHVQRGRMDYNHKDPVPMISILEEPFAFDQDLAPSEGRSRDEPYELIIQGFAEGAPISQVDFEARPPGKPNQTDKAHFLMADVKRRLAALKEDESGRGALGAPGKRIFRCGTEKNSILSVTWDGGVVRPPDEISAVAHFWMRIAFGVSTDDRHSSG